MGIKKIIYNDHTISSGEAELSLAQTLNLFESINWQEGSFLYFEINKINLFQILFHKEGLFLIEITDDSEDMVYLQKYADHKEASTLLIYYFNNTLVSRTDGFYKVPIHAKTLDDVLREMN